MIVINRYEYGAANIKKRSHPVNLYNCQRKSSMFYPKVSTEICTLTIARSSDEERIVAPVEVNRRGWKIVEPRRN